MKNSIKRVLILFPDPWLAYSPSILNLLQCLERDNVEIVIYHISIDRQFGMNQLPKNCKRLPINQLLYLLLSKVRFLNTVKFFYFFLILAWNRMRFNGVETMVIGVDSIAYLVARLFYKMPIWYSLEIDRSIWTRMAQLMGVRHLVIQTVERAHYLFGDRLPNIVTYLQNAPLVESQRVSEQPEKTAQSPVRFIYLGNIVPSHSVELCIDSVLSFDTSAVIHLRGPINPHYAEHLKTKYSRHLDQRVFLSSEYVSQDQLISFLSAFDIGFVFYDFKLIQAQDFNYLSCPSGKLFNYFGAGVPVIGSDIIGLKSVREFGAGVLLKNPDEQSIIESIRDILANYPSMSHQSRLASYEFDFNRGYTQFIRQLE